MNNPGAYTRTGVELAQQGRKQEALAYLRYAVTSEAMTPEVWLWLAHVTPDPNEYRHCVQQALYLQPGHPTAVRMQQDLEYQSRGIYPANPGASEMAQRLEQHQRRRRRLRRTLVLLNLVVFGLIALALLLIQTDRLSLDSLEEWGDFFSDLEPSKRLRFGVGTAQNAVSFQVDVPESWYLADSGSPSWRNRRDHLNDVFPATGEGPSLWESYETDLGEVTLDPQTGAASDAVFILETNTEKLADNPNLPPYLTLVGVQSLPQGFSRADCTTQQALASLEAAAVESNPSFVKAEVLTREGQDCLYYLEYRSSSDPATRFWDLRVPVEGTRLAIWQITVPAAQAESYENSVETILESLHWIGTAP